MTTAALDLTPFIEDNPDNGSDSKRISREMNSTSSWHDHIESCKLYFSSLSYFFTYEFVTWMSIVQFFMGGGAFRLIMIAALPLFKELGVSASRKQLYTAAMHSPMAMKPFVGVLSDLMPICGFHKKYYAVFSILVGFLSSSFLVGCFQNGNVVNHAVSQGKNVVYRLADTIVLCFCAISAEYATLDIMMEGKYSELMKLNPQSGSSIITFKIGVFKFGEILTQSYVGPLSDSNRWNVIFWISTVLTIMPLLPTLRGWLMEQKRGIQDGGMVNPFPGLLFDKRTFQKRKTLFVIVFLSGLSSPLVSAVTIYGNLVFGLLCSSLVLMGLSLATYFMFPRVTFWTVLAIIIIDLSFVDITSALEYFYTADKTCLPNGPNFDYTYYITMSGIVGSIVNFFAVVLYQSLMSNWRIRDAIILAIVIGSISNMTDLVIVMRWNKYVGISDKVFFLLGSAVFEQVTYIMISIPKYLLIAKVTPPQMESTVFAFVVGITNFCYMLSRLIGSEIIQRSGMITVGVNCDFDELPFLLVAFKIVLPLIVGVPATFLIRNVLQSEQYIDWDRERWHQDEQNRCNASYDAIDDTEDVTAEPNLLS